MASFSSRKQHERRLIRLLVARGFHNKQTRKQKRIRRLRTGNQVKNSFHLKCKLYFYQHHSFPTLLHCVRACLEGGRVTLASGLTLAGGQKIAWVYKLNFTGRVTLQPGTTYNARLHSKGLETIKELTRVGGLLYLECLQGKKFTRLPVYFLAYSARRQGNPTTRVTLAAL